MRGRIRLSRYTYSARSAKNFGRWWKKFGPSEYLLIESNVIDFSNNPLCSMVRENWVKQWKNQFSVRNLAVLTSKKVRPLSGPFWHIRQIFSCRLSRPHTTFFGPFVFCDRNFGPLATLLRARTFTPVLLPLQILNVTQVLTTTTLGFLSLYL
jgi:hypothetical protein